MAARNVPGIGNIQRVEVVVCHKANIFHPIKGSVFINCSTIRFHLPDMLSIENQLKISNKLRQNEPSKSLILVILSKMLHEPDGPRV